MLQVIIIKLTPVIQRVLCDSSKRGLMVLLWAPPLGIPTPRPCYDRAARDSCQSSQADAYNDCHTVGFNKKKDLCSA